MDIQKPIHKPYKSSAYIYFSAIKNSRLLRREFGHDTCTVCNQIEEEDLLALDPGKLESYKNDKQ